ncbi:MAG: helix-turn-helix domain-containing protein [Lachnospiraceae bacterium]
MMKMSGEIRKYIFEHNIDESKLALQTGINQYQLSIKGNKPFNAEELLIICNTLCIEPEELWNQIKEY